MQWMRWQRFGVQCLVRKAGNGGLLRDAVLSVRRNDEDEESYEIEIPVRVLQGARPG